MRNSHSTMYRRKALKLIGMGAAAGTVGLYAHSNLFAMPSGLA